MLFFFRVWFAGDLRGQHVMGCTHLKSVKYLISEKFFDNRHWMQSGKQTVRLKNLRLCYT